jgi:hypothetical protein
MAGRCALLAALGLLAAGCSDYDIIRADGLDVYYQNPVEAVDILLVVDNSCSMDPYQKKLGQSFDAFIGFFIDANVNYHIAVTTTDVEWNDAGLFTGPVITPDTSNASQLFEAAVNVGINGAATEMGLEAAKLALSPGFLQTVNRDFIRDEADLSIIFTSDEQDASPEPVNHYINTFFEVKGQRSRDVFNASALAVTNEDSCTEAQAVASSAGTRYVDVAEQTRGVVGNLCASDYASIVNELSLNASRVRDTFFLSSLPDAATLEVAVDDVILECNSGAYTYDMVFDISEDRPAIVFASDQVPPIDSRIQVRYDFGDGDPSTFCTGGGQ